MNADQSTVPSVVVNGNVAGSIVNGDNNFVVNTNNGTIIRQEALSTQKRNLSPKPPAEPEGFVGRKRELKQVDDWIAENNVVIICGMDGIGKTSLIKEAANSESARSQPDGVVFVDALDEEGNLLSFEDLVQRIFDALFETQPHQKVDLTSARTYLSNTQPLVLLNAITLTPKNLDQLQNLFSKAPILITTENTALTRGRKYSLSLGPLDQDDSLDLLASLANGENQETLVQIATLLENVPAALSIIVDTMRTDGLSADDVLQRLQSYTPTEQNKGKAALERAIHLLSSLLTADQHDMMDQVAAAFGISVDRKWLENEYGGSEVSEKLEERGLLHANSPRLRLMPGLKPILRQRRDLSDQRERLLSHLLAELKTRWNDFEFIKDELGNLLGLLFWAAAQGQWANVAALGRAIDPYLTLSGQWDAWHKVLDEIRHAATSLQDLALEGWVLHQLGTYEIGMGNLGAAQNFLKQAISIRKKLGDETGVAYSQHNLRTIAPVAKPTSRAGSLRPWLMGGIAVVVIGAFLFFSNSQKNQIQPEPTAPVIAATETKLTMTSSATPTATNTLTATLSPSPTVTTTSTPSPTDTVTPTPTYATLHGLSVNHDPTACRYGPGDPYLDHGIALKTGNRMDVFGRAEVNGNSTWLLVDFSPSTFSRKSSCWMNAKYLDITPEELMSVAPADPEIVLPIANYRRDPGGSFPKLDGPVIRKDANTVVVYWSFYDVPMADRESATSARYLIEAWVCKAGKIIFEPIGVYNQNASYIIQDEPGCAEPSHARLYLSWIEAYAGPVEIAPWP
jgi:NB-ARC domain-containing protein